ncbi:MAG: hypothetical protein MI757_03330 [Pirellulales bacterium]|nr:hypothetical protein [Pirellulales bacterium]
MTTEPITLKGVYLGEFCIQLDWQRLGDPRPYRIDALDRHPAASNEEVIHPHVDGGQLCEGEGHAAIRGALAEGRLADFFMVVRQVLGTYNSSSAYVDLESWYSVRCDDCGELADEQDQCSCEGCSSMICDSCAADCCACEQTNCIACSARCGECDLWFCKDCLRACDICNERICKECMPHELCRECQKDEAPDDESGQAQPAVHTDRVGQVTVPA